MTIEAARDDIPATGIPVIVGVVGAGAAGDGARDRLGSAYDDEDTRDGRAERVVRVARGVYEQGLDVARQCAVQAMHRLADLGDGMRPDEVELQVSISLDAGVVGVVKSGAEAQIQLTLRWQPQPPTRNAPPGAALPAQTALPAPGAAAAAPPGTPGAATGEPR